VDEISALHKVYRNVTYKNVLQYIKSTVKIINNQNIKLCTDRVCCFHYVFYSTTGIPYLHKLTLTMNTYEIRKIRKMQINSVGEQ
jgi:hypothetical protein